MFKRIDYLFKLCVFDLDGTLMDSLEDLANSVNYSLKQNGFPEHDLNKYKYFVGNGIKMLLHRALGKYDTPEAFFKVADIFYPYYDEHYADKTRPYEGIKELTEKLKSQGLMLAVLSNKADEFAKGIIDEFFAANSFSVVLGTTAEFKPKPDPSSLLHIMKTLSVSPQETLYVGDSNIDIFTAHNAGVKAVGAEWGFRGRSELIEAGADFLAEKPVDILKVIGQEGL
ncbi:MAG: HAD-IIIA family hydrolase [Bacillota bacterium]|nr:HAD-IIIA family hydrolase [Bacillota bacterium]